MAAVASAGADFILLDMEHSGWSFEMIKSQIAHAHGAGLAPSVNPRSRVRVARRVIEHAPRRELDNPFSVHHRDMG